MCSLEINQYYSWRMIRMLWWCRHHCVQCLYLVCTCSSVGKHWSLGGKFNRVGLYSKNLIPIKKLLNLGWHRPLASLVPMPIYVYMYSQCMYICKRVLSRWSNENERSLRGRCVYIHSVIYAYMIATRDGIALSSSTLVLNISDWLGNAWLP